MDITKKADVKVKVTKGSVEKGQKQITILGLPERDDKQHLSHKRGVVSTINFCYKKNNKVINGSLVVGDNFGIHRSHQSEQQAICFDDLFCRLSQPQSIQKDGETKVVYPLDKEVPLSVEVVEATSAASESVELGLILS